MSLTPPPLPSEKNQPQPEAHKRKMTWQSMVMIGTTLLAYMAQSESTAVNKLNVMLMFSTAPIGPSSTSIMRASLMHYFAIICLLISTTFAVWMLRERLGSKKLCIVLLIANTLIFFFC